VQIEVGTASPRDGLDALEEKLLLLPGIKTLGKALKNK